MRTHPPSRRNWYGRFVLSVARMTPEEMEAYRAWHSQGSDAIHQQGKQIEEKVFAALSDPKVSQAAFGQLLGEWVKATAPDLYKVPVTPQERRKGQSGNGSTLYMSGQNTPEYMQAAMHRKQEHGASNMGLIITPFTKQYLSSDVLRNFDGFGVDNGMFSKAGQKAFNWDTYEKMVKIALVQEKRDLGQFQFFAIPDVVADWKATMQKFHECNDRVQRLRKMGAPAAIVLQNGIRSPNEVPWDQIDTLFIGGDDKFKEGKDGHITQQIVQAAQQRGMNIHMGRVNTGKRMDIASAWGVTSADGTYLMHETAKTLWDIEQRNPIKKGETPTAYAQRVKHLFEKGDHQYGASQIVDNLILDIIDGQLNNPANRRHQQVSQYMNETKRPMDRGQMMEMDRHMPSLIGFEPDQDVVPFDESGNARVDRNGQPAKNPAVFDPLKKQWRDDGRVPIPGKDFMETLQNTNRAIARWRDSGIMAM